MEYDRKSRSKKKFQLSYTMLSIFYTFYVSEITYTSPMACVILDIQIEGLNLEFE